MIYRPDFYIRDIEPSFDLNLPGIYEWRIDGIGIYVGKALKLRKRINAYPLNVKRMIAGLHWHSDPTKQYRPIHYALRKAHDEGVVATVSILENCDRESRAEREKFWINQRLTEAKAGGLRLLNVGDW